MNRFKLNRNGEIYFIDGRIRCQKCKHIMLELTEIGGLNALVSVKSRGRGREVKTIYFEGDKAKKICCRILHLIELVCEEEKPAIKIETFEGEAVLT